MWFYKASVLIQRKITFSWAAHDMESRALEQHKRHITVSLQNKRTRKFNWIVHINFENRMEAMRRTSSRSDSDMLPVCYIDQECLMRCAPPPSNLIFFQSLKRYGGAASDVRQAISRWSAGRTSAGRRGGGLCCSPAISSGIRGRRRRWRWRNIVIVVLVVFRGGECSSSWLRVLLTWGHQVLVGRRKTGQESSSHSTTPATLGEPSEPSGRRRTSSTQGGCTLIRSAISPSAP